MSKANEPVEGQLLIPSIRQALLKAVFDLGVQKGGILGADASVRYMSQP